MSENIKIFTKDSKPSQKEKDAIVDFLHDMLEQFGDPREDIMKSVNYALAEDGKPGGFILKMTKDEQIVGAVVVNKTGMGGYIPENILVYIATHRDMRGQGLGKTLMHKTAEIAEGDLKLHVEPDNPARFLYEKVGYINKYLEMRYKNK